MARVPAWVLGSIIWGDKGLQASAFADDPNPHRNPQAGDLDWNSLRTDYLSQTDAIAQAIASNLRIAGFLDVLFGFQASSPRPAIWSDGVSFVYETYPSQQFYLGFNNPTNLLINAKTSANELSIGQNDPVVGAWWRNDGSNVVFSTKVGDIYNGYTGRVGLTHRFMDGAAVNNIALLSATQSQFISPVTGAFNSRSTDPTTSDIAAGSFSVWKNSTSGALKLWANDGGTMKSVTLA